MVGTEERGRKKQRERERDRFDNIFVVHGPWVSTQPDPLHTHIYSANIL